MYLTNDDIHTRDTSMSVQPKVSTAANQTARSSVTTKIKCTHSFALTVIMLVSCSILCNKLPMLAEADHLTSCTAIS